MQGVFFAAVKGQVLFLASRPDRGLRAVFPLAGAMECRTDNPCDRISTVPGSPASHRTAPAGFAALRGGIGRRDRGGIFGTAGAQTGVRVPDSDGGEVTPATRSRTGTQHRPKCRLAQRRPGSRPRRDTGRAGVQRTRPRRQHEGRGRDPGDRRCLRLCRHGRSTKAGVETPATRRAMVKVVTSVNEGLLDPGDRCEVAANRSTKAGVETPATPRSVPGLRAPLNEGRGRDPGDTGEYGIARWYSTLNEGRGRDPGDTQAPRC